MTLCCLLHLGPLHRTRSAMLIDVDNEEVNCVMTHSAHQAVTQFSGSSASSGSRKIGRLPRLLDDIYAKSNLVCQQSSFTYYH